MFKVMVFSSIARPSCLVDQREYGVWSDENMMFSLRAYGDLIMPSPTASLFRRGTMDSARDRAIRQAIPYAVSQVRTTLDTQPNQGLHGRQKGSELKLSPFSDSVVISNVISMFFGTSESTKLKDLEQGSFIQDLPFVRLALQETGPCDECQDVMSSSECLVCDHSHFYDHLTLIVTTILSMALLNSPKFLLLKRCPVGNTDTALRGAVTAILSKWPSEKCSNHEVLASALHLVGHSFSPTGTTLDPRTWMMSSQDGQVVWPAIYDTCRFGKKRVLSALLERWRSPS